MPIDGDSGNFRPRFLLAYGIILGASGLEKPKKFGQAHSTWICLKYAARAVYFFKEPLPRLTSQDAVTGSSISPHAVFSSAPLSLHLMYIHGSSFSSSSLLPPSFMGEKEARKGGGGWKAASSTPSSPPCCHSLPTEKSLPRKKKSCYVDG